MLECFFFVEGGFFKCSLLSLISPFVFHRSILQWNFFIYRQLYFTRFLYDRELHVLRGWFTVLKVICPSAQKEILRLG